MGTPAGRGAYREAVAVDEAVQAASVPFDLTPRRAPGVEKLLKRSLTEHGPCCFRFDVFEDFYTFWTFFEPGAVYVQRTGDRCVNIAMIKCSFYH
jgi:hypothetical protein